MITAMGPIFFHAVHFIWVLMTLGDITIIQSSAIFDNNATDPGLLWERDSHAIPKVRYTRDLFSRMPELLKLSIPDATGDIIELKWRKYESQLANKYLPVMMSSGESKPDVMENIGEFIVYIDLDECSTVVYFEKLHTLNGVIGSEYSIMNLPYDFDDNGKYLRAIDKSCIIRVQNTLCSANSQPSNLMQQASSSHETVQTPSDPDSEPPSKVRRVERSVDDVKYDAVRNMNQSEIGNSRIRRALPHQLYHLEILFLITRDVVDEFRKLYPENDDHIETLVRDVIIYFNTVNMIFQKFDGYKSMMQINIAKIIIEDSTKPFDFIGSDEVDFSETVTRLRQHLSNHQNQYPPDSFDHIFISTNRPIRVESAVVPGKTTASQDMYSARDNGHPYDAVPITVLGYINDYLVAAHEISQIFNAHTDVLPTTLIQESHCSSILQIGNYKGLKWSSGSQTNYRTFFRENKNRCFQLNFPRSLRQPGPSRLVTPFKQCQCYGSDSYKYNCKPISGSLVRSSECDVALRCGKKVNGQTHFEYHILPFDGTPCGSYKACWNGKCTHQPPRV